MLKPKFYFKDKKIQVSINPKTISKENPMTIKTFLEMITSCTDQSLSLYTQSNEKININISLSELCSKMMSNKIFIITAHSFRNHLPTETPTIITLDKLSKKNNDSLANQINQNTCQSFTRSFTNALIQQTSNHYQNNNNRRNAVIIDANHYEFINKIRLMGYSLLYDENGVNRLVDMGFPRERAIISMRMANNDLEAAANIIMTTNDEILTDNNSLAINNEEVRRYQPLVQFQMNNSEEEEDGYDEEEEYESD